jgi:hypothetical protein
MAYVFLKYKSYSLLRPQILAPGAVYHKRGGGDLRARIGVKGA